MSWILQVRLQFYDLLVLRGRYTHWALRAKKIEEGEKVMEEDRVVTTTVEGREVRMKCVQDDQGEAQINWQKFHKGFAKFVR